ncbi:hypothetical protein RJ641_016444 [Dillenia turbinata]
MFYIVVLTIREANSLPFWRIDSVIQTVLIHVGPVVFLYYWFHRELHQHYLYSRYHSHHHSSIVPEPITRPRNFRKQKRSKISQSVYAVCLPFAEHIGYFTIFAVPLPTTVLNTTASIVSVLMGFMNNMGHRNF